MGLFDNQPEQKKRFDWSISAWLDRMMRPNFAVANVVKDIVDEGEFHPVESAVRGFTGKDKTVFSDVLSELGFYPETKTGEFTKFILGLGLDIALDPLTYVTAGAFTKIGKLARVKDGAKITRLLKAGIPVEKATNILSKAEKAGKITTELAPTVLGQVEKGQRALLQFAGIPVVKGERFFRTAEAAGRKLSGVPAIEALKGVFVSPKTPVAKAIRQAETQLRGLAGKEQDLALKLKQNVDKVARRYNRSYDDMAGILSDLKEQPSFLIKGGVPRTDPDVANLLKTVTTKLDDIAKVEQPLGILGSKLMEDELDYIPRIITKEARNWLSKTTNPKLFGTGKNFSEKLVHSLPRKWRKIGSDAIEQYYKQKGFTGKSFFIRDPAVFTAIRGMRSNRAVISNGLFNKLKGMPEYLIPTERKIAPRIPKIAKEIVGPDEVKQVFQDAPSEIKRLLDVKKIRVVDDLGGEGGRYLSQSKTILIEKGEPILDTVAHEASHNIIEKFSGKDKKFIAKYIRETFKGRPPAVTENFLKNLKAATDDNVVRGIGGFVNSVEERMADDIAQFTLDASKLPEGIRTLFENQFKLPEGKGITEAIRVPLNWKEIAGIPELKGFAVAPDVAKDLERVYKTATNVDQISKFIKFYDDYLLNPWKITTLAPFPAYHVRNMLGNTWNNWLAGVKNPLNLIEATKLQRARLTGGKTLTREIVQGLKGQQVLDLAETLGVLERGWFSTVSASTQRNFRNLPIIKQGSIVGRNVENNARLWHFIEKMKKGFSPTDAAVSVKKFLFDYGELTQVEQQVFRRVFPFYTWSRKNIPLQLENIVRQPGKGLLIPKLKEETWAAVDRPDKKYIPEWLKKRQPMFISKKASGEFSYFPLESWVPFADITKLDRPFDLIGEMLSPAIKIPIELTTNKVFYFDQPIEDYPGETEEFLRLDVPAWVAYMGRQVRGLNEIQRMIGYTKRVATQPPQPSMLERIVRASTGIKVSRYDIEKAKTRRKIEIGRELAKLKTGFKRNQRLGRTQEIQRILPQIDQLQEELKEIK